MRLPRLLAVLGFLVIALLPGLTGAPVAAADPPLRLPDRITDRAGALTGGQAKDVQASITTLYDDRKVRLWVVYVDSFDGTDPTAWADSTMRMSSLGDRDVLLAVATADHAYAFRAPSNLSGLSSKAVEEIRRNSIEPLLANRQWAQAASNTASALDKALAPKSVGGGLGWGALVVAALAVLAVVALLIWRRIGNRRRDKAEVEAVKRVDPTDGQALAQHPVHALDQLSKAIVVDVDNAVRTSDAELALAVDEFGPEKTAPFTAAVDNAKTALSQAFATRQRLDDAIPETPAQQRDMLIDVIVSAAKADRELETQSTAFDAMRDLVINAPDRLDALTQQLVAATSRIPVSEQTFAALQKDFDAAALASIANNVAEAKQRIDFADKSITTARGLIARPAGQQDGLVDAVRAAESALTQAGSLLDAVDNAATDIRTAVTQMGAVVGETQKDIDQARTLQQQPDLPSGATLATALQAAQAAVDNAAANGKTDPLSAFAQLSKADAELDKVLATAQEEKAASDRLTRAIDQALATARPAVAAASNFIETHRGSIEWQARTKISEAQRHIAAGEQKRTTNPSEALAHANAAISLAQEAQSIAAAEVDQASRAHFGYGRGYGGPSAGAQIGGIVVGNILGGMLGGALGGGWGGGGLGYGESTSFGGSSHSSGNDYFGGGGRF